VDSTPPNTRDGRDTGGKPGTARSGVGIGVVSEATGGCGTELGALGGRKSLHPSTAARTAIDAIKRAITFIVRLSHHSRRRCASLRRASRFCGENLSLKSDAITKQVRRRTSTQRIQHGSTPHRSKYSTFQACCCFRPETMLVSGGGNFALGVLHGQEVIGRTSSSNRGSIGR
jgi:hypothetical protein